MAPEERLNIIETALQQLRGDLEQTEPAREDEKKRLALAAKALFADYAEDDELRAFSVLDSEDFNAWGRGLAY